MSDFLLRASRLGKRYGEGDHAVRVLESLDLAVLPAERIAVIGESGVGKSTLLHVLGTLDRPNAGRVELAGRDLFSLPPRELAAVRNREIGFVFQLHHLLPDFSSLENVMLPGLIVGIVPNGRVPWQPTCWNGSGCRNACATGRVNCRAANNSAWPWRVHWC